MSVSTLKDRGKNLSYLNIKKKREIFYFDKQNSSPTAGCKW